MLFTISQMWKYAAFPLSYMFVYDIKIEYIWILLRVLAK